MFDTEIIELPSGDLAVEIPQDIMDELDWKEGDCLVWSFKGESLMLMKS
jgi:antitoxin component of MazEF toxin-antitoxin module